MPGRVIVITGAAGFLGSAATVALARSHTVIAIDRRDPSLQLRHAAPDVRWHRLDIADREALRGAFRRARADHGHIDVVLHLAAYYHFGSDWRPEYERTNVRGTTFVLEASRETAVDRLIFASSIAATRPAPVGQFVDESTPAACDTPYGRSKALGEQILQAAAQQQAVVILRIGGVFSDWCELPPLYSLLRIWAGPPPLNRVVVGSGKTGFPFIHRADWVRMVEACVDRCQQFHQCEVLMASQHGAVLHDELFAAVHRLRADDERSEPPRPIRLPVPVGRLALGIKLFCGVLTASAPCERPWMLRYTDRPWVADTSRTRHKLQWDCRPELSVLARLPVLLRRFRHDRDHWERRNRRRNALRYQYTPDDIPDERPGGRSGGNFPDSSCFWPAVM